MTDRYAVFGNPIAHSLSPKIHAFFARDTGDELSYEPILVPEGRFADTAHEFFCDGKGCNVTVPCKLDAYAFADVLTPYAEAAGAVNTLKKLEDGRIEGDNTDGRGLTADLKRLGVKLKGAKVLVMGAGGAARGIIRPLQDENTALITIVNRTIEKAKKLAEHFGVTACSYEGLSAEYDVIINATSTSLNGTLPPLADEIFRKAFFAYDLMYKPDGETVFTKKAFENGCTGVADGFGMLIMQAALSFELWRGVKPDVIKAINYFRAC